MHVDDTELNRAFIIAEVGRNHQGDPEKALEYVKGIFRPCADAVKFQKETIDLFFQPLRIPNRTTDTIHLARPMASTEKLWNSILALCGS